MVPVSFTISPTKKTIAAAVTIPQLALSVQMIDQGDGNLCISSVSEKLPWNLSHAPSLSGPSLTYFVSRPCPTSR